ncbi:MULTISPECIES: conjugal transfer protein TraG N-terminal domain-containing protein [Enterobacteriaceae]|uniref:TraG N-terminal Proteobacteria domain-containing protein n=16 Tax=Enterobacterales TaxID=91347 RepID=A0A7G9A7A2_RAOOR|nr:MULTISPECIES: conjugal transfer protein TraG N-terminal domain-containing protein [Enterobacteriaceae]MDM9661325.1 conjugal transfer protein TraG N-terminal domain-containing protein [Raoultella planticola]EKW4787499.1 conjugal transfer protein TraG N-terminal domain-containing protein [Klebsiella variicola]ELS4550629.1 conjugal transfer protein TraG N-terminal domain-containing protein [Klebsiella michiganensis]MCK1063883.1 conjugal transfer protein TraG N-terminal domain-containing protein
MSNFTIYTIGETDFVYTAFNGIALIFSSHGSNEWIKFAAYAAAIGLFYKSMKWVLAPNKTDVPIFSWIMGLLFYSIAVIKADVTLESVKTGEVRNIDDVPLFIAASGELTTGLLHGLITDWRAAFDPLTPVGQVSDTLDDSLTLGPMTKMVKYMEWGGESSGFCQAFPNTMSGSEKPVTFDVCRIIQSIARDCIKTTQDSEVQTALRGVALNEIYATDLGSVINVMDSMTANSLKTASVPMVTSTGLQYASCTDAWAAVKAAFASPQGASIMRNLGQMNQFIAPQQEDNGQQTDFIGGAATTLFGSAGQAHNITTAAFVLNQVDKGVLQYRKALGIAADYQLFEASMKRTNAMVSQGQLWLNISGAAISFLEMFSYMVAPFALIAILFLGGEGIASAAKYLQLIVFVNMWPITAVMVNAYVKMVLNQQFDTWTSLGAQTTMNWANMGSIQETYGSYLSVASALYCMVPMLTLFLLTTSIHPMMGALKNVTPDAPSNTGHVTPEVWSAGSAGKQSFGDQTHTAATSTGGGMSSGGLLNSPTRMMPTLGLGSALQDTVSAAGQNSIGTTRQSTRTASQIVNEAWSNSSQGSRTQTGSSTTQGGMKLMQDIGAAISSGVGSEAGLSTDAKQTKGFAAAFGGAVDFALGLAKGGGGGNGGGKNAPQDAGQAIEMGGGLRGYIQTRINNDSSLTDSQKKAFTDSLNNVLKDGSSFAKDIAKFESNSIQNGFTDSDSYQKVAQQMQQHAQSISNSETNGFSKTGGQASQLSMSNSLNIDGGVLSDTMSKPATEKSVGDFWSSLGGNREAAVAEWKSMKDTLNGSNTLGDTKNGNDAFVKQMFNKADELTRMGSGETVAQNLGDIQQTSKMFKNAISMMGANAGILAPAAEKLDQFVGLGSGGNYASHQEQTQKAPDTSAVPGTGDISGNFNSQRGQVTGGLGERREAAKTQPGTTIGGMSAQSLKEDDAKQFVANRSGENEGRILSTSQREALQNVREKLPESNQKETLEKALQAADKDSLPVKIAGGVQSAILGDAESVDYDAATQQTMSNMQSREPPKNAESFRPSGDKTADAKETLTQAALHSENARHQTGEAREKSLAQSEAYRNSYNNVTGGNLTTSDVSRVARLGADGKNNGFENGLSDVVKSVVSGSGTTGARPATGTADYHLGEGIRDNNGHAPGIMNKIGAAAEKAVDNSPLAQRIFTGAGSDRHVANSMEISGGSSQGTLIGNMTNNIQLEQTIAGAQNTPGITEDKFTRMSDQSQQMMSNVQHRLSEDPRYGPEAAADYPRFVGNLSGNLSERESSDKAKEFLDKHRKS